MKTTDICCSCCHQKIMDDDLVTLDIINTITHQNCKSTGLELIDSGTFNEMLQKYSFLR